FLVLAGCTIDPGPVPDTAPCAPSPDFFVTDVWPRYLEVNGCPTAGCHDFSDGHGYLRLQPPEAAPAPGLAIAEWPSAWRNNYLPTTQLLRCDAPADSRLLSVPEGVFNLHPPGPVVLDRATANLVIETWIGSP